ncbi:hypothetical protein M378DRAFT_8215 [Amanita muscaria Koide BX008]|uniref:Uncharacterized protein n=1 Tax=Amanita muscaria (strain Koide BX008) TaxID=946122 RepID=A0A0C2X3K7_AMAMK|nr:hypothetical protein M378DRAFT_8215 [Amanita muscaria Koide BX008]
MPLPKVMIAPVIGFMMEFGETLKRHSQLHHRQVLAWRMIRLTKDLNKILALTMQESPSRMTASYTTAKPLRREPQHPRRPRAPVGPHSKPAPMAESEPPRTSHTSHSGPTRTPLHDILPDVHTLDGSEHTIAPQVGLQLWRRPYPVWKLMLGRPLHIGLLINHRKTFIMKSHEESLTHPLTILGHRIEHHEDILVSLVNLTALIMHCTATIPPQEHPDYVPHFAQALNEALLYALEDTHYRIRIVYSDNHTDRSIGAFRKGRRPPKGHPLGLHLDDLVTAQLCTWTIAQCTRMIRHWEGWPLLALSGIASDSSGRVLSYARTTPVFPLATPSHGLLLGSKVFLLCTVTYSRRYLQPNDPTGVAPKSYVIV